MHINGPFFAYTLLEPLGVVGQVGGGRWLCWVAVCVCGACWLCAACTLSSNLTQLIMRLPHPLRSNPKSNAIDRSSPGTSPWL